MMHVPYRGSAPMMTDLIGGQISMAFDANAEHRCRRCDSGKVRALGARHGGALRALPNLPTLQEQGMKGFECYTWNAIMAPAGTPQPIVDRLAAAIKKAMEDPAVHQATPGGRRRSDAGPQSAGDRRLRQGGAGEMGADHQGIGRTGRLTASRGR